MFSAVPKPDVDFVKDLVKQQTDEVLENLCNVYDWISKSANVEDFFANLLADMFKENISIMELRTRGQNTNKLWSNYRKGAITASKTHSVLTKLNKILKSTGVCVDMWSLSQNISELSFTNPVLPALKYGQTMKMEAADKVFKLMKKKHKNLVISEFGLFLDKINCFIGASPDRLITCYCCGDACTETTCPLSINYEKPNKKKLGLFI